MWRLSVELRLEQAFSERAERIASRIGAALLFLLAAYVTVAPVWHLWTGTGEEFSWPGFIVAPVAIPTMRWLAHRKIVIAEKIGSPALRADAIEAATSACLSQFSRAETKIPKRPPQFNGQGAETKCVPNRRQFGAISFPDGGDSIFAPNFSDARSRPAPEHRHFCW